MDEVLTENKQIYTVPQSYAGRNRLRKITDVFANSRSLVPPLSMSELSEMADEIIRQYDLSETWKGWLMVEINNCVWRDTVAAVPYEKRILLLPQCLSNATQCRAKTDELGLLCMRCGSCKLPTLQDKAAELGIMSIVAEGFAPVMGLLESGVVHTVIGVGCLDSLEKAFPLLVNHAIPGIAVPLNKAGCRDTKVDYRYVEDCIRMYSPGHTALPDYNVIKDDIRAWFSFDALADIFRDAGVTSLIARRWLSGAGKRWRPFLLVSVYLSITGKTDVPEYVKTAAVAVECFHKASLVHDDIQDCDEFRYGKQTVHALHGIPMAINVGDLLLGEGYRILSMCSRPELVTAAASAHILLCKGQGMELEWSRSPRELTLAFVIDIFRCKTVPAFEVALDFGVRCAGNDEQLRSILHEFSFALGIAYQLQDDTEDYRQTLAPHRENTDLYAKSPAEDDDEQTSAPAVLRPSAVLAILCEQNRDAGFIKRLSKEKDYKAFLGRNEYIPLLQGAVDKAKRLSEEYRQQAIDSLSTLDNAEMKRILFRVTERILNNQSE
jgi:geranylgeranyl pyrophosphate synthase